MCGKLSSLFRRRYLLILILAATLLLFMIYHYKILLPPQLQNYVSSTESELKNRTIKVESYTVVEKSATTNNVSSDLESPTYQLIRNHCKIPRAPLLVKEVMEFKLETITAEGCSNEDSVTQLDMTSGRVSFNQSMYKYCCYKNISRPHEMMSDSYILGQECEPLFNNDVISSEFFMTICSYQKGNNLNKHRFHANIPVQKPSIVEKVKYWQDTPENERPPSVLMLPLDSTSSIHGHRSLPKTMELLKKLNFIDFKGHLGHHALGEPTQTNAIPLLLGEESANNFFQTKKPFWGSKWDKYPFIWKLFDRLKYLTYYSEDIQLYGTFQYSGQTGFTFQPCDIYLRPLILAQEQAAPFYNSRIHCLANETIAEFVLKHHLEFLQRFKGIPNFSLNWLCWPQHDAFKLMPILDEFLFDFFTELSKESRILSNTVIIIFGDHGIYKEPYGNTKIGMLERKLPLLLIRYPENLSRKYPQHLENLKKNAYTITSHHDTYQTLIHLIEIAGGQSTFKGKTPDEFRYSLLEPIPENRTCNDAHIPAWFCACNDSVLLDADY